MIKSKKILIALAVIGANVLHNMPVHTALAAVADVWYGDATNVSEWKATSGGMESAPNVRSTGANLTLDGTGSYVDENSTTIPPEEISFAQVKKFYAGYSGTENVTNNVLTITGGTFESSKFIYGGYGSDGNAENNTVTISGGTFGYNLDLYGGYSQNGAVSGNLVKIENGNFNQNGSGSGTFIYGGRSEAENGMVGGDSADKGNKVVIDNAIFNSGTSNEIYGGYAYNTGGIAKYNNVTINNGTFRAASGDFGLKIIGGKNNNASGWASNNKVVINGGTFEGSGSGKIVIKGGTGNDSTGCASSTSNAVEINGGSFKKFEIYGAHNSGDLRFNSVTIKGGTFQGTGLIYGSKFTTPTYNMGNQVVLEGGVFSDDVKIIVAEGKSTGMSFYSGNSISIQGTNSLDLSGASLMGYETSGNNNSALNVNRTNVKVGGIKNFETLNFTLPEGTTSDDIVLKMQGTALDLFTWNVGNITVSGITLADGDYITLMKNVSGSYAGSNIKVLEIGTGTGIYELVYYGSGTPPTTAKGDYTIKQGDKKYNSGVIGNYTVQINGNTTDGELSATSYSGNEIIVRRGTYSKGVYGAYNDVNNTDTSNNTVNVYDGTFESGLVGGYAYDGGNANGNTVNFHGGKVTVGGGDVIVYGGTGINATGNTVNIYDGNFEKTGSSTKKIRVYAGYGNNSASGNELNITGGSFNVADAVFAAGVGANEGVTDNVLNISGGNFMKPANFYGGLVGVGDAEGNFVTINGGTFGNDSEIYGAWTSSGNATENKVTINAGTFGDSSKIYGGYSDGTGTVSGNFVTINDGTFGDGSVICGARSDRGDAMGNHVTINGGTFTLCTINGGNTDTGYSGSAIGNSVIINGGTFNTVEIFVGNSSATNSSNNTLDIRTKMVGKAAVVAYAQNMNFTLPSNITNGDVMLKTENLAVNAAGGEATINVYAAKGTKLKAGDVITLVDVSTSIGDNFVAGDILGGAAELCVERDDTEDKNEDSDQLDLVITLLRDYSSGGDEDQQKAPVEGIAAAVQIVNQSADLASGEGMASLIAETAGGETNTFGALTTGQSKYKTGSHVDVDGWGVLVGAGKTKEWKNGSATTYGVFFEYGKGDFDTYNGNVHGDGNSENKGIGIMARHKLTNNTYYEGNIRYGKQETEWGESEIGSYDTDSKYYGIMVGMGQIFPAGKNEIDVYGRYTFGHVGACDAKVGDNHYHFDSVKSHRVRVGGKYNFKVKNSNAKPYVGLAWEHEFKGEARASISGVGEAPAPSMKGNTGIMEVGCDWKVSKKWTLGLGANAYIGKRKGWDGMARVFYNF